MPQIDESQDWYLIDSAQNSTHTSIQFNRPLITCDPYDRDITRDSTRVIYAYGDSDPKSETDIEIHGRHQRGVKSILFLTYAKTVVTEPKETDIKSLALTVNNVNNNINNFNDIFAKKIHKNC